MAEHVYIISVKRERGGWTELLDVEYTTQVEAETAAEEMRIASKDDLNPIRWTAVEKFEVLN